MSSTATLARPAPEPTPTPAPPPPTVTVQNAVPLRTWAVFVTMVFGMFMAILDIQIVSSSLTEIQAGLSASPDEASWVQTAYLVAEIVMIPLSGVLSRLLSTRVLFALSCGGFTLMSFGCAIAWNLPSMIAFRALQGFLGGAMIPTAFAASFTLFPPQRRATVSVVIGLVATMGPTIGPTLGGWLTEVMSWHWLFLVNVLPGITVTTLVWLFVDFDRADRSVLKGFDVPGLALMAVFLGALEYIMEEGPRKDWLGDATIFWMTPVCLVAAALFFWRMFVYQRPIVDLRAFTDRNFAIGCVFAFVLGIGLYGSVYIVPLFLARVRGLDSLQIGEIMVVTGLFQFISSPLAGALSKRLDLRLMLALGFSLFGLGVYLTSFADAQWGFWQLFLPQALRGLSLMLCFLPINTLALGTLPPDKLKNASGLYNLMRNAGGAIGLAAINTVLNDRTALHWARLVEHVNLGRPEVRAVIAKLTAHFATLDPAAAGQRAMAVIWNKVQAQATIMAFDDALLLMALVFLFAFLTVPFMRKPRQGVSGGH